MFFIVLCIKHFTLLRGIAFIDENRTYGTFTTE